MKHCNTHHKKHRHSKHGRSLNNNSHSANVDSGAILNRVVSLLLTGLEMAILGKVSKNSDNLATQTNYSNNTMQSSKRKKCSNCNGRDCATCIKN